MWENNDKLTREEGVPVVPIIVHLPGPLYCSITGNTTSTKEGRKHSTNHRMTCILTFPPSEEGAWVWQRVERKGQKTWNKYNQGTLPTLDPPAAVGPPLFTLLKFSIRYYVLSMTIRHCPGKYLKFSVEGKVLKCFKIIRTDEPRSDVHSGSCQAHREWLEQVVAGDFVIQHPSYRRICMSQRSLGIWKARFQTHPCITS